MPWLNDNHPKLHIVNHRDYIPEECLPTFGPNPLMLNLHRIPGLSDRFVLFNDDTFVRNLWHRSAFSNGLLVDFAVLYQYTMNRSGTFATIVRMI